jgi:peptide/nickel transport system permease protein
LLFLLITVRAVLPLNTTPWTSVIVTFALLGLLGWAGPARIIRAGFHSLLSSDFVLQARACGCSRFRLLAVHVLPNLKPILHAQFWIAVPFFILAEANLGLLGLGVAEPLPSFGNLLRSLGHYASLHTGPWILAPVLLLLLVTGCLEIVSGRERATA